MASKFLVLWKHDVDSNEELDTLLARAPVYNLASYQVLPLAEMRGPAPLGTPSRTSRCVPAIPGQTVEVIDQRAPLATVDVRAAQSQHRPARG
jgi:hypothetical protein